VLASMTEAAVVRLVALRARVGSRSRLEAHGVTCGIPCTERGLANFVERGSLLSFS
jgi:hypothetical protein